jgi:hypothetical protein
MSGEYYRGEPNKIPGGYLFLYLGLSLVLCYLYHKKIVAPFDWNAPNSLNAVASYQTAKPYQFRLLLPLLFDLFRPISALYGKYIYSAFNVVIVFLIQVVYYKLLCGYFRDKKLLLWITPVILYPMLWNFIILNQSFQYYDFTAILLTVFGLYFITRENFTGLIIIFILGVLNKETIGYLGFSYLLYNYKIIFTRKIIINTAILGVIIVGFKLLLNYTFRNNPGDPVEICYNANIQILSELFSNRIMLKHIGLNFGGLYIFVILLFATGKWLRFPNRRLVYVNLAIVPFYIFGIFVTYITEVRVYTELIPMITTLFLIYLSNFKWAGLHPYSIHSKKTFNKTDHIK